MTCFHRSSLASMVAVLAFAATSAPVFAQAPPSDPPPNGGQNPDNDQFDRLLEAEKRYRSIAEAGGWPALPDGPAMKPGERHDCARLEALGKRLEVEGYRSDATQAGTKPATTATPPATQASMASAPANPAAATATAKAAQAPASAATATAPASAATATAPAKAEPAKKDTPSGEPAPGGEVAQGADASAESGCEYGPGLVAAVEDFQYDRYLTVDGIVGGQTQRQLAKPVEDVLAKIEYALKRWRANASHLSGTYILVNIPAFDLAVYEGRREVMRMPVIVGQPDWETPEMGDKIDSIVVNPSWNIPKSIAEAEVLPRSRKDGGYLARQGIVSDGDGTLSQKPGPRNPLGRLKFMMPNRDDIYLHDTPGKQKFDASTRAFSHGCVRVDKPVELAAFLLKDDPEWSREKIQAAIDAKATKTVKLTTPTAVHLLYIPAVVSTEGRLRVAPDIYDKVGNASDEKASLEPAPTDEDEFLGAYP